MKTKSEIPPTLVAGGVLPAARGFLDGHWYVEEGLGAARLGIRIRGKLHEEDSKFQKITVYDTAFFGKLLSLDGLVMLTERDEFVYHEMLTHLPLLSLPEPRSVLIIGGGDCGCLREILRHRSVQRVVQVEIDERVTRVCEEHFAWVRPTIADKRAQLLFDDGIHYVEKAKSEFDLVIIDSTDPRGPGVGLFVKSFYQDVIRALRPGGVMVAQTESPHWDPAMVGAIYCEMRAAFKKVDTYWGSIPTYPSGMWTWAYASTERRHDDYFDDKRAAKLEGGCRYYNRDLQQAAFALPNFIRAAVAGDHPFPEFEKKHRELLGA